MSVAENFFTYWYFHIPNFILAALIYTLIGRYLLGLLFSKKPEAVILRVFESITDPILEGGAVQSRPQSSQTDWFSSSRWPG